MAKTTDELDASIRFLGVLIETVIDQNKAVLEAVSDMQSQIRDLPTRDEFSELHTDVRTIRAAVTDTSQQVHGLEERVLRLETQTSS